MVNRNGNGPQASADAYSPKEMAYKARSIGVTKARLDFLSTLMLSILAGAFIAVGAAFYTTVITGLTVGLGIARLLGGISFSLGLILVVVAGAELFTGNTLVVVAFISGKIRFWQLMRNWGIVYLGNFIGSIATAAIVFYAWHWKMGGMTVGATAYGIAASKLSLPWATAFCSGILCNGLVCLAVWLCYSARSTTDKILSIVFPIAAFVAMGFEHSVANMFFIPYGMMLCGTDQFMTSSAALEVIAAHPASVFSLHNFLLNNLVPVTIGNIVGGAVFVGVAYWIIYLRSDHQEENISFAEEPEATVKQP